MSLTKYDYYGNYDKEDDNFTISVHDIHKKQKDRERNRMKIYSLIGSRCFKKVKDTAETEDTFCLYYIPEYIPGYPIYNLTECVMYLLNVLQEKGFKARYCEHCTIYISWNLPKANLKLIEQPKEVETRVHALPEKRSIVDQLNLKYKPIESYKSFNNFIPRKKS